MDDEDIKPLRWSVYLCIFLILMATYIDAQQTLVRWSHPPRVHKTYQPPVDIDRWDDTFKSAITPIQDSQN
jgi:hypothetical protein